MGATDFLRVQLGQESAWGTAVAATAWLMGVTDRSFELVDENYQSEESGHLAPSPLVAQVKQSVAGSVSLDLTYEDILFLLEGAFGAATPSGADPYTWAYAAPYGTAPSPQPFTIEYGDPDSGDAYKVAGAIFDHFAISGDIDGDGIWQASADILGKSKATVTMASLNARAVELIRMADTALYIDAWGGTIGSTQVSSELKSFALDVSPNYHLKWFDGDINPGDYGHRKWAGTLAIVAEFATTHKAIIDALLSSGGPQQRQIRIKATSGSHSATIDFAGSLLGGYTLYEDLDGNLGVSLEWTGTYNSTLTNWLELEAVNSVASLP